MCVFKVVLSSCVCWAGREPLDMSLLVTQRFFCDGVSEGIPLCVLMCILTKWLLCPQLSRLKQELAQMRQELQYKEMGVETLQE